MVARRGEAGVGDAGDADLEVRAGRNLAILDGVEGALEVVDVAAADPDVLESLPWAGSQLERPGERQMDLRRRAAGADAAEFVLDADWQSAGCDQLEERALGIAGGDDRRGVEPLARSERDSRPRPTCGSRRQRHGRRIRGRRRAPRVRRPGDGRGRPRRAAGWCWCRPTRGLPRCRSPPGRRGPRRAAASRTARRDSRRRTSARRAAARACRGGRGARACRPAWRAPSSRRPTPGRAAAAARSSPTRAAAGACRGRRGSGARPRRHGASGRRSRRPPPWLCRHRCHPCQRCRCRRRRACGIRRRCRGRGCPVRRLRQGRPAAHLARRGRAARARAGRRRAARRAPRRGGYRAPGSRGETRPRPRARRRRRAARGR